MSTLQTEHLSPTTPITAQMGIGEWMKVVGLVISASVACAVYVSSMRSDITQAAAEARQAANDAKAAIVQATEIKRELSDALKDISGQLGYIRGTLERLTQETHK